MGIISRFSIELQFYGVSHTLLFLVDNRVGVLRKIRQIGYKSSDNSTFFKFEIEKHISWWGAELCHGALFDDFIFADGVEPKCLNVIINFMSVSQYHKMIVYASKIWKSPIYFLGLGSTLTLL